MAESTQTLLARVQASPKTKKLIVSIDDQFNHFSDAKLRSEDDEAD